MNYGAVKFSSKRGIKKFPRFPSSSYEIVSHKKVVSTPGISTAIATGKKYLAWFTFQGAKNVCYLIELNKTRTPSKIFLAKTNFDWTLSTGTIVYGTIPENADAAGPAVDSPATPFLVENIYQYKGIPLANFNGSGNYPFGCKMEFIRDFMTCVRETPLQKGPTKGSPHPQLVFHLPPMWYVDESNKHQCSSIPEHIAASIPYTCHHIQYKELNKVSTFFNFNITKMKEAGILNEEQIQLKTILASMYTPCIPDLSKPQYKVATVFRVTAAVQYDIYHLFAIDAAAQWVYYGVASIPSYEKSVMMNLLFRNIRENENIDYIEESDTEEDFENLDCTRYVDLEKEVFMECIFHEKFRKWVPMVVSSREKVVGIEKLVKMGGATDLDVRSTQNRPPKQGYGYRHGPGIQSYHGVERKHTNTHRYNHHANPHVKNERQPNNNRQENRPQFKNRFFDQRSRENTMNNPKQYSNIQ